MDYYQLFDLKPSLVIDKGELRKKYLQLSSAYHPDRFVDATLAEQEKADELIALINKAYTVLNHEDANMQYLLELQNIIQQDEKYNLPQAFLMEMLELNEELSFADEDAKQSMMDHLTQRKNQIKEQLMLHLEQNEVDQVKLFYYQLKYIDRLLTRD